MEFWKKNVVSYYIFSDQCNCPELPRLSVYQSASIIDRIK
jgi:hypothetical protein